MLLKSHILIIYLITSVIDERAEINFVGIFNGLNLGLSRGIAIICL